MNEACCTNRVISSDYKPVGKTEDIDGMDIFAYDVFGFHPATQLGCDLLASSVNCLVAMPDLFRGHALPLDLMPIDSEEKNALMCTFREGPGSIEKGVQGLLGVIKDLEESDLEAFRGGRVEKWGLLGFCWGGKVAAMTSGADSPFKVSGTAHPSRLDPAEARAMTIPHIVLFSPGDGTPEARKEYAQALANNGQPTQVETFENMIHGWMAARANLKDEKVRKEFDRGYQLLGRFYGNYL